MNTRTAISDLFTREEITELTVMRAEIIKQKFRDN